MAINFKDFAENVVLTATEVDNYLMKQAVVQVDTYTDLASVAAGVKVAYCIADGLVYVYDGANWGSIGTAVGGTAPANPTTGSLWYDTSDTGTWSTYSPTLSNWTLGNGTVTGRYTQVGKTVHFIARLTLGSTTTISGNPTFTLPVQAQLGVAISPMQFGAGSFIDNGVNAYNAALRLQSSTTVSVSIIGTNGVNTAPTSTTPFTWGTNDLVLATGTYEAQ